jgi:thymidylate synthase (FAD)
MHVIDEIKVHDHGWVKLLEVNGSDELIEFAARQSPDSTKKKSETRDLIRFLAKAGHHTPFEFGGAVFQIKLPIFVMRQLVRHRMSSMVEKSMRYSEPTGEFYVPDTAHIRIKDPDAMHEMETPWSGEETNAEWLAHEIICQTAGAQDCYDKFVAAGTPKELARVVMPVGSYTIAVWKINLRSLFNFLKLRLDKHAQLEIQDYAQAIHKLIRPHFPDTFEAFDDYVLAARTFSGPELRMMKDVSQGKVGSPEHYGMSEKEYDSWADTLEYLL